MQAINFKHKVELTHICRSTTIQQKVIIYGKTAYNTTLTSKTQLTTTSSRYIWITSVQRRQISSVKRKKCKKGSSTCYPLISQNSTDHLTTNKRSLQCHLVMKCECFSLPTDVATSAKAFQS